MKDTKKTNASMGVICTKCEKENFCGCPPCKKINKNKLYWEWYEETFEICGNCGTSLPHDNLEFEKEMRALSKKIRKDNEDLDILFKNIPKIGDTRK